MAIRPRGDKWVVDFYDQHGERHWETVSTKKEARDREALRRQEVGKGQYILPQHKKITFKELSEKWLQNREGKLRPSSLAQYQNHLTLHLLPFFGPIKVGQIDFSLIETYSAKKQRAMAELEEKRSELVRQAESMTDKAAQERRQMNREEKREHARLREQISTLTKQQIGIATINKTLTTLGTILKYAVKAKLIDSNPVSLVERPKEEAQEYSAEDEEMQILSPEQIRSLLAESTPGLYRTLLTTAIMTGMREGELLALQEGDIDWVNFQILVRRTLSRTKDGWKFYEPKTKNSKRRIDVDPSLLLELKKWILQLPNRTPGTLVFSSPSGQPLHRSTLYKQGFLPAIRRSGVPRIRFHDLRHTYASLLIAQGEHPKYIQMQMGHSSIKVTMDVYGHLMEKVNVKAANRLAQTVFGEVQDADSSKMVANSGERETEHSKSLN